MLDPVEALLAGRVECRRICCIEELSAMRPDIVVTAHAGDPAYRRHAPQAMVVFTRHGFATKGVFARVAAASDYTCMPSPWSTEEALARGTRPRLGFWTTGFPAMDRVFNVLRDPASRMPPPLLRDAPPHERMLLYAPTYNEEFSAEPVFGPDWIPAVRKAHPSLCIVVKPHPVTAERQPGWMARWRAAAAADPLVRLAEDPHEDIYPYYPFADAMLSDASSAMFYFLAVDKPLLLATNPSRSRSTKYFDPEAPEWTWRDVGHEVDGPAGLVEAVGHALAHPGDRGDRRRVYRERVFGELTDGRAAERVAERILALAASEPDREEWVRQAWWAHRSLAERDASIAELESGLSRPLLRTILDRFILIIRNRCGKKCRP